eukprot:357270-Chlamydomonas_euryale.AAC.21
MSASNTIRKAGCATLRCCSCAHAVAAGWSTAQVAKLRDYAISHRVRGAATVVRLFARVERTNAAYERGEQCHSPSASCTIASAALLLTLRHGSTSHAPWSVLSLARLRAIRIN